MTIDIIGVGSKSASKVRPTEIAARHYWKDVQVIGKDVDPGISLQPLGHEETELGAINRAKAILLALPHVKLGIGIEGGVIRNRHSTPILMSYIAITNGETLRVTPSTGTPIPEAWAKVLEEGGELRPLIMSMNGGVDRSAIGLLTNEAVSRDDTYIIALRTAFAPWANPQFYR